jgi:AcrR family transcriptional regulator
VDGASMEQIARRAGVGKLTVYRRWSSKEELLAQAIEAVFQEREWLSNEDIETGSPAEIIERTLPAAAEVAASPQFRALVSRVYGSAVSHPALMETYWRATTSCLAARPPRSCCDVLGRKARCPPTPTWTC